MDRIPNDDPAALDPAAQRELEALLSGARESAPATLDARVTATLAAAKAASAAASATTSATATATAAPRLLRSLSPRRRIAAAAAVLLGATALTFAAVRALGGFDSTAPELGEPPLALRDGPRAEGVAPQPIDVAAGREPLVQITAEKPEGGGEPGGNLSAASPLEEDDWDPPADTTFRSGFPRNLDAHATVARAAIVARVRTFGGRSALRRLDDGTVKSFDRPLAVIERVYHGDRSLVGRRIELHARIGQESERSFLAWGSSIFDAGKTRPWITTFELIDKAALPDGTLHAQQLFAELWGGTIVTAELPPQPTTPIGPGEEVAQLLSDLVASLAAAPLRGRADEELAAVVALRHFDGGASPLPQPDSSVWHDPAARTALFAAAASPNATVRWNIAWMNPAAAGPEGVARLFELAFDRDPLVRQPALHWLARPAEAGFGGDAALAVAARELVELATPRADTAFDELLTEALEGHGELFDDDSLARHLEQLRAERDPESRRRAVLALTAVQQRDAVQQLLASLADEETGVRQAAALVLAGAGFDHASEVMERLRAVPDDAEPNLQALVGYAEIAHGSIYGYDRMERLLESDAPAVREQVVQLLARAAARPRGRDDAVLVGESGRGLAGLLLRAADDADPLVRSHALVALGRLRGNFLEGESLAAEWEAALERAAADSSSLVRAAVELARRARDAMADWESRVQLESLGYVDDEDDGN
ncbi:MAG: hypothetical protein JNL90_16525 [Planctomycetes bacterium]|nr:hypothetical protein [Planctomycetota bacterium]